MFIKIHPGLWVVPDAAGSFNDRFHCRDVNPAEVAQDQLAVAGRPGGDRPQRYRVDKELRPWTPKAGFTIGPLSTTF